MVGARTSIVVAMDWTDFDAGNRATIMLALISDDGRATPLVWLTVDKSTLKDRRSFYEHQVHPLLARSRKRRGSRRPPAAGIVYDAREPRSFSS